VQVSAVDLARGATALGRTALGGEPGYSTEAMLGLAARLADPTALVATRQALLSGQSLVGRPAAAALDLIGPPDVRLGNLRRGAWYYDLGPSQRRVTVVGGRVASVADITGAAQAAASLGPHPPAPRPAPLAPPATLAPGAASVAPGPVPAATSTDFVAALPGGLVPGAPPGAGASAADLALSQIGTPYLWGGESPGKAFDCSGLVQWAYAEAGVRLPRVAVDQAQAGEGVPRDQLQVGDVLFFADASGYVHHDGIYIGGGRFVHAPASGQRVRVERLDTPHYAAQYAGARRYAPPAG
jgi:cell wall-associated NlpC family hydrolase